MLGSCRRRSYDLAAILLLSAVVVVVACATLARSQAVLRAINGASKSLEWTSTANGDLSFSHNTKQFLTFLSANSNSADFPQGRMSPNLSLSLSLSLL